MSNDAPSSIRFHEREADALQASRLYLNRELSWLEFNARVLAEADPQCASAAVCVYLDGMSHEEAAEVLEVSRRTVGNLLERFAAFARKRLSEPEASHD